MKSAIYNEVPLVLLASKLIGRPVKWMSTRSEAFLCDAQARDNVTDAELALDKDGTFLGFRVIVVRQRRRLPAIRLPGLHRQPRHARRRLPHAGDVRGIDRGVHPHPSDAALSRQRPARGRLRDRAHGRRRRRRAEASTRPSCGGRTTSRRRRCRSRPASPSPTTAASSRRAWTWRSSSPTSRASPSARRNRRSAASCAASACPTPSSAPRRRASRAPKSASTAAARCTIFSGSINQGQGHETTFKQVVADKLGIHPDDIEYIQGDTDKVFFGEGTGGSRSATMSGSAFHNAAEKVIAKAKAIAAHNLKVDVADVKFDDGIFSSAKTNQTMTIKDVAQDAVEPGEAAEGHGGRAVRHRGLQGRRGELPERRATSARSRSTRRPATSRSCTTAWSTTSAR